MSLRSKLKFSSLFSKPFSRRNLIILGAIVVILAISATLVLIRQQDSESTQTGYIYLNLPQQTAKEGEEMKVEVKIDTTKPIDTATATIKYDPQVLSYKSTDYNSKAFDSHIPAMAANDTVLITAARLKDQSLTGNETIATITFVSKQSKSTEVSILEGNAARTGVATNPSIKQKEMAGN